MARGRMIDREITSDKKINELSDDTSRLAYTWLITFADCEGRTHGDPAMVRSMLFPRREEVTTAQMETYIKEWADAGLVVWYSAQDDLWIYFPAFGKHNMVNRTREAPSKIPAPTPDQINSNVRVTPDQIPLNIIKENRREGETSLPSIVFEEIKTHIEQLTGVPAAPQSIKAIEEIVEMGALGVDIRAGYEWLKESGKQFKYYGQLVGPTRTAMSKRTGGNGKDPHAGMVLYKGEWRNPINVPTEEY